MTNVKFFHKELSAFIDSVFIDVRATGYRGGGVWSSDEVVADVRVLCARPRLEPGELNACRRPCEAYDGRHVAAAAMGGI